MKYRNLLFDLDGTLIDPKAGITRSIQYALEKLRLPVPEANELEWCIGPPLHKSFAQLAGPSLAGRALDYYRERYEEKGCFEHRVYPGVFEMLFSLRRAGARLFIATSKPEPFARKIGDHFALTPYFEKIYGSELDGARSDKTDLLQYIKEESALEGPSLMVGDRGFDMIGALQNQMVPLGVTYGYGSPEELLRSGAVHLCSMPMEVVQWLGF